MDPDRLIQTALEQNAANAEFREIGRFLRNVTYLHLVPQLIRFADAIRGQVIEDDPFGQGISRTRRECASKYPAVLASEGLKTPSKLLFPQFEKLEFIRDNRGRPHLQAHYSHWCSKKEGHHEDQFSDGVLRLIGTPMVSS